MLEATRAVCTAVVMEVSVSSLFSLIFLGISGGGIEIGDREGSYQNRRLVCVGLLESSSSS